MVEVEMAVLRAEGHGFAGPLRKVAMIRTGASSTAYIWWGFKVICIVSTSSWREALISTSPAPTGSSNPPMRRVRAKTQSSASPSTWNLMRTAHGSELL
jgi:hypothetical protein